MAEAHGQLTGRPAVALATRAVGAANLAIGIHTARADSSPMFAIVGQVARANRGREAFQEVDLRRLDRPARQVGGRDRHRRLAPKPRWAKRSATRSAAVRVRSSWSIPEDVLDELVPGATGETPPFRPTRVEPDAGRRPAPSCNCSPALVAR